MTVINTTSSTTMYEHIFRISGDDLIIGISFPRYSTMAVEAMDFARSRGAHAVAITDSMASPLVLKKKDEVSETFRALEQVWNREGVYTNHEDGVKKKSHEQ